LLIAPVLTRWDPRAMLAFGFCCYAAGSFMMASYNLDIGVWDLMLPQLLQGIAITFIWMPIFHMIYVTLAPELRTDAATLIGLVYNLVSSAGVAFLVALLSRSLQINSEELGANATPANEMLRFPEYAIWDMSDLVSLATLQAEIGLQAMMISYVNVFWVLTWASLAALPLLLLIPSRTIPRRATEGPAAKPVE
jgi:DHA2 family multidrug resistance protein